MSGKLIINKTYILLWSIMLMLTSCAKEQRLDETLSDRAFFEQELKELINDNDINTITIYKKDFKGGDEFMSSKEWTFQNGILILEESYSYHFDLDKLWAYRVRIDGPLRELELWFL